LFGEKTGDEKSRDSDPLSTVQKKLKIYYTADERPLHFVNEI
jgi:hypothetical protein